MPYHYDIALPPAALNAEIRDLQRDLDAASAHCTRLAATPGPEADAARRRLQALQTQLINVQTRAARGLWN